MALCTPTRSTRLSLALCSIAMAVATGCATEGDDVAGPDARNGGKHVAVDLPFPTEPVVPDDPGDVVGPEPSPTPAEPAGGSCAAIETFETGKTPTKIVHVDDTGCSDTSGTGGEQSPFCTIGRALQGVRPGTAVRVHSGTYAGGGNYSNIVGTASAPIWIGGAPGEARPVIRGGDEGMKLSAPLRYLIVHDLEIQGAASHGINVDDGLDYDNEDAVRWLVIRDNYVHHAGDGSAIDNCLKVSGVNDFVFHDNEFYRCGMGAPSSGSGDSIDLVGCHRGLVARNFFRSRKAVQVKGGSEDVEIRWNRSQYIDEGTQYRVYNLGGSTGSTYFRPPLSSSSAEARNIRLVANVIDAEGAQAAFAFAGCVDCLVANNTIVNPDGWIARILWENTGVQPPKNGRVANNLVYWDSSRTGTEFQVGSSVSTASTFELRNNLWFDWRSGTLPDLDSGLMQTGAIFADPQFVDGEFHIDASSPAAFAGVEMQEVAGDLSGECYAAGSPSVGAFTAPVQPQR